MDGPRRLYRSRSDRMLAGVCAGMAHYLNMDPAVVRVLTVLLVLITGIVPGIIAYLVFVFVVPEEPGQPPAASMGR